MQRLIQAALALGVTVAITGMVALPNASAFARDPQEAALIPPSMAAINPTPDWVGPERIEREQARPREVVRHHHHHHTATRRARLRPGGAMRPFFRQNAERSFDPLMLTLTPVTPPHLAQDSVALEVPLPTAPPDSKTAGGASDLLAGPPTSTSIDTLARAQGHTIMIPVGKLLRELSGPTPQ